MLSNLLWWPWAQVGQGVVPPAGQYNPVGDSSPALPLADLSDGPPIRRSRRRRRESILDQDEDIITILLSEL